MSSEWKQRQEGGGRFAIGLIGAISRHGGRALGRLCLYPITVYFLLKRGAERRASRAYLARALGLRPSLLDVARHIHTFASTILDRVFLLGEQAPGRDIRERFDVSIRGLDGIHAQLDQGRGVLLFGSHLGSFEVLRVLARQRPDYTIRVVLDKAHSPAMTQLFDAMNPEIAANVIDGSQDGPAIMLAIQQAAEQGHLVALLVDRAQPGHPTVDVPFLGAPAEFPTAPWLIAAVLKVPVSLAFGLYHGGNRYELVFETFSEGLDIPRRERAAAIPSLIRGYAARLEHYVRYAPYNWFNFYDFWGHGDACNPREPTQPGLPPSAGAAAAPGTGRAAGGDAAVPGAPPGQR
ncbi:acyltransferase [Luteimonas vadosa]|uniref:Acyltransferase n=1 Tax=Luteimonas vadosa TaxID=1165507 RepID=A0ABP9DT12_9GAMM